MHKTEGDNNSNNLFVDGPPGTRVTDDWLNAIQNEIRNAIEDAGLVLKTASTETGNQLSAAIVLLATTQAAAVISDTVYGASWNGVTTIAPSKNALYDKIETLSLPLIVQEINTQSGAVAAGSNSIPEDDTIPQITEGNEYMTRTITPTSATNKLKIEVVFFGSVTSANQFAAALFQNGVANALACGWSVDDGNEGSSIVFTHTMVAGTTSEITFSVRAGYVTGTTTTFNGWSSARKYGGVVASSITVKEIRV